MAPDRQLRKRAGTSGWPKSTRRKAIGPRPLKYFKDTSIVLPHTASREARLWAEVAYIVDEKLASGESTVTDVGVPDDDRVQIDFEQLINRVNQRGMDTRMGRKETRALDARNILQDTGADVGHLELRYHNGTPRQIETITVLPEARKKLAASVQRMRAYPDVTDLTVYQGTLALAKRHFLPEGSKPTTKAQLAEKNIEKYEKLLSLEKKHQATLFVIPSQSEVTAGPQDDQSMNEAQALVSGESEEASHSMATKDPEESLAELEQGEFNMSVSANAPITPTRALQPINWVHSTISGVANIWYNTPESLLRRTARNPCLTPSPVSQVEDVADDEPVDIDMPGRYEEDNNVGKLFQQNVTFEGLLAALGDLYTTTLEKVGKQCLPEIITVVLTIRRPGKPESRIMRCGGN
ncbi:hypothetical protein SCLCIDRAFT_554747 [Scleroderma citrinum Foug A]|uniref:Uncharacterized protein n=1 Tax=Scleroderma citrinum Foug A TaxID=1036808 RepID=A0A0C3D8K1_9AGAM|nr:hypothetical protein SCLCIDRAFT_554747 [Scleroderma citrinum Foug A]